MYEVWSYFSAKKPQQNNYNCELSYVLSPLRIQPSDWSICSTCLSRISSSVLEKFSWSTQALASVRPCTGEVALLDALGKSDAFNIPVTGLRGTKSGLVTKVCIDVACELLLESSWLTSRTNFSMASFFPCAELPSGNKVWAPSDVTMELSACTYSKCWSIDVVNELDHAWLHTAILCIMIWLNKPENPELTLILTHFLVRRSQGSNQADFTIFKTSDKHDIPTKGVLELPYARAILYSSCHVLSPHR